MEEMLKISLEEDKRAFALWRAHKNPGEEIPEELWNIAIKYIDKIGIGKTGEEFRLSGDRLKNKALAAGVNLPNSRKRQAGKKRAAFIEINSRELIKDLSSNNTPRLLLERADGSRMSWEGIVPDSVGLKVIMEMFYRK